MKDYKYVRSEVCDNCGFSVGVDSCCFDLKSVNKDLKVCKNKRVFV
jgi:hypothetical protein